MWKQAVVLDGQNRHYGYSRTAEPLTLLPYHVIPDMLRPLLGHHQGNQTHNVRNYFRFQIPVTHALTVVKFYTSLRLKNDD